MPSPASGRQPTIWADGTAEHITFGALPLEDQGVPALIISPESTELAQTPLLATTFNKSRCIIRWRWRRTAD